MFIEWLLKRQARRVIDRATEIDEMARANGWTNRQWWLDYQDDLNALSVYDNGKYKNCNP